ncbi:TonB-dependent receptor [Pedobacter sp. SG908]|uniref:SusC/RagA family TonB-linked outer membrane protein n=2 Tax=Pedobacter TaxID=84567 RepID=UPI00141F82C0|nr:TonB-dependent receptor [Pedobacter sp. SG908]NII83235.1 TonB-linked SusC/RagA family outer membrane protein [Pedobacter sp. SG908]
MKKNSIIKGEHIFLLMFLSLLVFSESLFAQQRQIGGKVTSADGLPIPGAVVKVKGKTGGTGTSSEGKYTISAQDGDILQISSVGFVTKEVPVGQSATINISLAEDKQQLDEVVVVGYGVQQKKLVTGATVQVKGETLQKQSTTNALQGLQGQTPGVQITSTSGQPGENIKVTIRGLGTIGNASPLYVVDGVLTGDITYLNSSDIESIDVLKDAASAAIYGSQAANGVVLVTTRQGKRGQKGQITFDAYAGVQNVAKKIELLDASQYAAIMSEAAVNSGKQPLFTNDQIKAFGKGTSWMDEMFVDNALTQNYALGASGASETSVYSLGLSYTGQEGIVGGKGLSNYERYSFKINSEHNFYKDIIKIGQHLTYTDINNNGILVGNQYNNTLRGAFSASPFLKMYDENGNFFDNSKSTWNNGEANPYALMVYNSQNKNNTQRILGDIYMVIEPIKNLKFRTSLGIDYSASESRSYTPVYSLSVYSYNLVNKASQSMNKGKSLIWDNLLSYKFKLGNDHTFEAMVGSSAYRADGSSIFGTNTNLIADGFDYAWLSNATGKNIAGITIGGRPNDPDRRLSYFGRLNYNYKEKFLLNTTFRADGSSRFGPANRWGYFPSVSVGWVVTNESFMQGQKDWLDFLKVRASWGQVGSQNIDAFQYLAPIKLNNTNYIFGPTEGVLTPGGYQERISNPAVKWETSEQTNIGFDANFLQGKFALNFDWYNKTTKDWLIAVPILATAGANPPFINGGNVRNTGIELALTYKNKVGEFNYSVGVNGAYNKNKVENIPTSDGIIHGGENELFNNALEFYRAQTGFPIGYFWGLKTAGIFQNEAEVQNYRSASGKVIQPTAAPGDVKYVDVNGDGMIDNLDRGMIGNPNPNYTFGITLSGDYKGFDFSVVASGVAGNDIVQSYRNPSSQFGNYTSRILDRWHGEGTSNTIPRVTEDNRNWSNFSDLYIQKGDFLRISNITVGYNLGKVFKKSYLKQVRLYAAALNVYTFTKYDGMDPEIGYGTQGFASGIDLGYYPRPRTFMIGANLKF